MHTEATVDTLRIWTATFMNKVRALDKQLEPLFDKNEKEKPYLNLNTVKFHSIADYPNCIIRFGSTDSYSTAIVSLIRMTFQIVQIHSSLVYRVDTFRQRAQYYTASLPVDGIGSSAGFGDSDCAGFDC